MKFRIVLLLRFLLHFYLPHIHGLTVYETCLGTCTIPGEQKPCILDCAKNAVKKYWEAKDIRSAYKSPVNVKQEIAAQFKFIVQNETRQEFKQEVIAPLTRAEQAHNYLTTLNSTVILFQQSEENLKQLQDLINQALVQVHKKNIPIKVFLAKQLTEEWSRLSPKQLKPEVKSLLLSKIFGPEGIQRDQIRMFKIITHTVLNDIRPFVTDAILLHSLRGGHRKDIDAIAQKIENQVSKNKLKSDIVNQVKSNIENKISQIIGNATILPIPFNQSFVLNPLRLNTITKEIRELIDKDEKKKKLVLAEILNANKNPDRFLKVILLESVLDSNKNKSSNFTFGKKISDFVKNAGPLIKLKLIENLTASKHSFSNGQKILLFSSLADRFYGRLLRVRLLKELLTNAHRENNRKAISALLHRENTKLRNEIKEDAFKRRNKICGKKGCL